MPALIWKNFHQLYVEISSTKSLVSNSKPRVVVDLRKVNTFGIVGRVFILGQKCLHTPSVRTQRPQNALGVGVRTQRPTHLPLATVELRYKVFKTLVGENQTLFLSFQTHDCDTWYLLWIKPAYWFRSWTILGLAGIILCIWGEYFRLSVWLKFPNYLIYPLGTRQMLWPRPDISYAPFPRQKFHWEGW